MKKRILTTIMALSMFLASTGVSAQTTTKPLTGMCIVMVHGILGFDDTNGLAAGLVKYWGGMDQYLRDQGAKVATPGSSAMASIQNRATQTRDYLNIWMPANGCSKIHFVGHSQGGLVVRYITKNLGYSTKVASVTTVNSLHKGTPIADISLAVIPDFLKPALNLVVTSLAKLIYRDGRPQDVIDMAKSLTVSYLKTFNSATPNASGVKYYSYGSKMAWADPVQHLLMAPLYPITWAGGLFYGVGGDNDGVVPISSQSIGTWKGSPSYSWWVTGLDHLQMTNFEWSGQNYFDVKGLYLNLAPK